MRNISRRAVLTGAGVTAMAAALHRPQLAFATGGSTAATSTETLLANVVAGRAGTAETNATAAVQPKLADIHARATSHLAALLPSPSTALFDGLPLGTSDSNLTTTYLRLYEIALATATPIPDGATVPDDLSGNDEVRQRVVDGLRWLHEAWFSDTENGYYGNWYNWEIGIPTHVSRTLALLGEGLDADPDLARDYVATMDAYLRNGKDGDVDLDSRFHTGANLADITTNRIVQGAVLGDVARIEKAIADQLTVYRVIDPYDLQHGVTDGFYADGSFLMHSSVPYTGSYGVGLLDRVTTTVAMLDGTEHATDPELQQRIGDWLATAFAPVIVEGWMMEIIKGRSVSRTTTGYQSATSVVESVVDLSAHTTPESAEALRAYVAHLHGIEQMSISPASFDDPANIVRHSEIVADDDLVPADLVPASATFALNAMDRHVHHRPGWTFTLARSSERVSMYEYMNGENLRPWFQGSGVHYLYLGGEDQQQAFGVDYVTVVDAHRLAGAIAPDEERLPVPELYGQPFYDNPDEGFTSSSEKQNAYVYFPLATNACSGGTTLGDRAVAAMQLSDDAAWVAKQAGELPEDFVAYASARASRSWVMLDDEVVALATGVSDEHGRATLTTLDARISDPTEEIRVVGATRQGEPVTGPGVVGDLAWLRYENVTRGTAVGYVLLAPAEVEIRVETVERSRRWVRTSNSATPITKRVFDVVRTRPAGAAPDALAWAILPGADEAMLASYAGVEVVAHDEAVHAVRHSGLGLLAVTTFGPGTHRVGNLTVDGAAAVLAQDAPQGRTAIAVSDPTFGRDAVTVTVPGRRAVLDGDPEVTVEHVPGGTRLRFGTHHAYGATRTVTVRGGGLT